MTGTPSTKGLNLAKILKALDPGKTLYDSEFEAEGALQPGEVRLIFPQDPKRFRHELYIFNKSPTVDIHLRATKTKSGPKLTIPALSDKSFVPHQIAQVEDKALDIVYTMIHCGWIESVYLYNPSGGTPVHFEAYEVF